MTAEEPREVEVRDRGVGGSDVAAILGLHPHRTPYEVYLEKVGEHPGENRGNAEAMFWGTRLEPVVAHVIAERRERVYATVPLTWVDPDERWRRVNPDGLLLTEEDAAALHAVGSLEHGTGEVLEVKTTSGWRAKDWADGEAPVAAVLQCLWAMDIGGQRSGVVGGLIGGQRLRVAEVEYDEALVTEVRERVAVFWFEHVLERRPPPVTAVDVGLLRRVYRTGGQGIREATPEAIEAFEDYRTWQGRCAQARAEQEYARARLMAELGDHDELWDGERRIAHYTVIPGGHVEYERPERRQLYVARTEGS